MGFHTKKENEPQDIMAKMSAHRAKKNKNESPTKKIRDANKNRKLTNFYNEPAYFKNGKYTFNFLNMEYDIFHKELTVNGEYIELNGKFNLKNKDEEKEMDKVNDSEYRSKTIIKDLKHYISREEKKRKKINNVNLSNAWSNTQDGVFTKSNNKVTHYPIEYLKIEKTTNPKIAPKITIRIGNTEYQGIKTSVINQLCNVGEVCDKSTAYKLFDDLMFNNKDKIVIRNDGGYLTFEELPSTKPELHIHDDIISFIGTMNNAQKLAFKLAILLPFANIIRNEWIIPRKVIKALILTGAAYNGKTVIPNVIANMFTDEEIKLLRGGCPQSSVALRNALSNNIGIVMCDECDNKYIDKSKKILYNDIEELVKGLYQNKPPSVSDQNNQGHLLDQEIYGVPIMTMNDIIYPTEALKDRIDVINFDNPQKLFTLDLPKIKSSLRSIGQSIAYVFYKNIDQLRQTEDNIELINLLLQKCEEEYTIDLSTLIQVQPQNIGEERRITNCIHKYMMFKLERDIMHNDVFTAFIENWYKFDDWIAKVGDNQVIIRQKKFNDFIRSSACLNDGGISSQKIGKELEKETGLKPIKKQLSLHNDNFVALIYDFDEFIEAFNLTSDKTLVE